MASSPGRLAGAMTVAALMLGAIAEPAAAKVTFSGIGDVQIGMSEADVKAELGRPSRSQTGRNRSTTMLVYRRQKLEVFLYREQDRVVSVGTKSRAQRTSSGLGVGSSTSAVRAKPRDEKCGTARGILVCSVQRGERVMDFEIRRGKVFRVAVADLG
jgi:hypothetical protein